METLKIAVADEQVSGLLLRPANAKALYLFAHGAGAGMTHRAMESNARGLSERSIATLRYQFLYMEKGSKRPDLSKARTCSRPRCRGGGGAARERLCPCSPEAGRSVGG